MAYNKPRPGDVRVTGPLSTQEAEEMLRTLAETITRMGHGSTTHYYVAKYGKSHAVYRCATD